MPACIPTASDERARDPRDMPARAVADQARLADDRPAARGPTRAADAALLPAGRAAAHVSADRRAAVRPVPVHHHVPGHLDRDAARANHGTLERLMTLPVGKADILFGYGLAFGLLAALQAVVVCTVGFFLLGLQAAHGAWLVGLLAVGNALLGMALGLFASAYARTEFQAVQFMPALILPQILLCGL